MEFRIMEVDSWQVYGFRNAVIHTFISPRNLGQCENVLL